MTITTRDQLIDAMGNNSSRIIFDKASIANVAAGQYHSLWRATGQPGQAAVPSAAAVCNNATLGAIGFAQQTSPATSYLGVLDGFNSGSGMTFEIHDRLMHMGGLNGTLTTGQAANVDLLPNLAVNNINARKGDANYSDVQWWLEWYTDTGATAVNVTVAVTYDDGTTGNLTTAALAATRRASFMLPLNSLIPAAAAGKFIRAVNTVTLSGTTATAGSFGVTATRYRAQLFLPVANSRFGADWAALGLPKIANGACLQAIMLSSSATSTGAMRASGKIIHG